MKFKIYNFDKISSTQDKAKEFGKKGLFNSIIIAKQQSKGRGRMQRKWQSTKGNIYMSIALNPDNIKDVQHLTLAAAISVVKVLKKLKINAKIKWPNDVNFNGQKLCGILTEGTFGQNNFVVLGMGINVNQTKFSKDIEDIATSLKIIKEKDFDTGIISNSILNEFYKLYRDYQKNNLISIRRLWYEHSDTIGKNIKINTTKGTIEAKAVSLNKDCSLKVKVKNKVINIYEGDVSINY